MKSYVSFIKKDCAIITMEHRTEVVSVRMTKKEYNKLEELATFWGLKIPQYVRWVLFKDHREILYKE